MKKTSLVIATLLAAVSFLTVSFAADTYSKQASQCSGKKCSACKHCKDCKNCKSCSESTTSCSSCQGK